MIKAELVRDIITEGMEFKSKKAAKEYADVKIQEINDLIDKIGEVLEPGEKAKVGSLEISKVEVAERSGVSLGKAWSKPAEVVVRVKKVK